MFPFHLLLIFQVKQLLDFIANDTYGGYFLADHETFPRICAESIAFKNVSQARRKNPAALKELKAKVRADRHVN